MKKVVYSFGEGVAEGDASMREELGGKGANLAEMTNLGLPIPPGFTISAAACREFLDQGERLPDGLAQQVNEALARLEEVTGKRFGDKEKPLLISVRSGAAISMPGMMDTVLNLGLNDSTVRALARVSGDERFAQDCRRRFIQMYGNVVLGLPAELFETVLAEMKASRHLTDDTELQARDWAELVRIYQDLVAREAGQPFPEDPQQQLFGAIEAVFSSWNNKRAVSYRRIHGIPADLGTAVNVQSMVFGNLGEDCATGVAFTRDPSTGEKRFYGEWLPNAQGEDVVAGIRTPRPINREGVEPGVDDRSLECAMPDVWSRLVDIADRLERHYHDMQDIEFTIEHRKLYMLQTRTGKRTGLAAVRIAVEMVDEGRIGKAQALRNVAPDQLVQLLAPVFPPQAKAEALAEGRVVASGLPAGPGAACGRVVLSAEKAVDMVRNEGQKVILVRTETSPEDIEGMEAAEGILTARGGMTSHAAVVARGRGKSCVVGCGDLVIDPRTKQIRVRDRIIRQGDWVSIDGSTGELILGQISTHPSDIVRVVVDGTLSADHSEVHRLFFRLLGWAGEFKRLGVRANADEPEDARVARLFGAEGIGLCRTEHMFFDPERIRAVRAMILADGREARQATLARILPLQREDFAGIFRAMEGLPVTIRLLDPPLHEFLPRARAETEAVARELDVTVERLAETIEALTEMNPMLGHRGCRLGLSHPEIYDVQVQAIFEAACHLAEERVDVRPEIMIPLVGSFQEIQRTRKQVVARADEVMERSGQRVDYTVGTMIEVPRACLVADRIATEAQFFSFGTNDLTQMGFGFSRDDVGSFLPGYLEEGILPADPFRSLDREGIGQLVRMAADAGRRARPDLKLGICGEHGGDPASIEFFDGVGLDYVSCSPYRVPVARLAAARAALADPDGERSLH
ncbi:MAG: pyruvate, phosphate dikinase [Acidobacteriota bacterium]